MFAALLTTAFFSFSILFAQRSLTACGQMRANLGRLLVAVLALGLYAHTCGTGFRSASTGWLFLSGVVGMGLGDIAMFMALPRLGTRLSLLMMQCLAAPIAAGCEWLWLGTALAATQLALCAVILTGVAFAFMPDRAHPPRVKLHWSGFVLGVCAAAGQGIGAIITRKGSMVALAAGEGQLDGVNAAYHRILGGLILTVIWFALLRGRQWGRELFAAPAQPRYRWVIANGLAGPVFGVSCYQWALATTPSGIVLPIVATSPLLAIPLAWWLEGDRPTLRSILGGVIAVGGVIGLTLVR
ncbi:MAG: DMT family transporter [Opitutaceae bacterium]|nr:DMT family transporter [Opitutaceae bacterium]MBP9913746.1 DMT family transporter [Opitutaceae bacterium]